MKPILTLLILLLFCSQTQAQQVIQGKVINQKGRPVRGAAIALQDSYDGATSDSLGQFSFSTTEKGKFIIEVKASGYKDWMDQLNLDSTIAPLTILLKENQDELKAVVITAGSFEAGDKKRGTVLTSLDIVTTASANADITSAIRTLPGTQQIGETEGLFVRGGAGYEAKTFIDGTMVNNPFFSSVPNIAQRGRFSPFLFKGTVFSSGGYSALYGQALSSALILESIDLPEKSSADIGVSTVGLNGGFQHLSKDKKSSWGINYSYTNLLPYFKVVKQQPDYFKVPEFHNIEGNFRVKTKRGGMVKMYAYSNFSKLGLRSENIDSTGLKNAFALDNLNLYSNLSWRERWGNNWSSELGISFSKNRDEIEGALQNADNKPTPASGIEVLDAQNFSVDTKGELYQARMVITKKFGGLSAIRFGGEQFFYRDRQFFNNPFIQNAEGKLNDNYTALFAETDLYITSGLAAKPGIRAEYSSLLGKYNLAPRFSLAQRVGEKAQVSAAYGIFYQKPENNFLFLQQNLGYTRAAHYILNYQLISRNYTLRTEVFYKKYDALVKTVPDTNNNGKGYAKGFELFWRDRKTIKNMDYWISYSWLDTERDHLNFPFATQPGFAANHTASLVMKKFVTPLKTNINGSYTYATGRPYFNPNKPSDQFLSDRTRDFHSMSLSFNYLPNIGKKTNTFVVWVLSINNVLGANQVYNYSYSNRLREADGSLRAHPIGPPAKRFIFLGCFISIGTDRTDEIINSNL
ncbi:TonB-dependent receptor [Parasegetibacter sp. NRK P23]|uniref:TonB-dependent receptor n=1 Tax=Parasegetibacter sp. NRK P23 TaxID=2942999 RepID=UPI0020443664|nr:TonB-dependent receptor [Parasegetibacter sp. NRK P23]MCM5529568.1 TonB-dependent receptor [Parasegetibacter sp. NRK P23]